MPILNQLEDVLPKEVRPEVRARLSQDLGVDNVDVNTFPTDLLKQRPEAVLALCRT